MSATAAVLVTAGWAAAQAPVLPAIDNSDYSRPATPTPARPAVPAPGGLRAPAASPVQLTSGQPDSFPVAAAPVGVPVEEPGAGPGGSFGDLFGGGPDNFASPYRFWASGDFLVWKIRGATLPGLASSVPFGLVRVNTQDRFENPDGSTTGLVQPPPVEHFFPIRVRSTAAVADGESLNFSEQLGDRFTAGVWLDPDGSLGVESTFFFVNRESLGFSSTTGSSGDQSVITFPGATNNVFIVTPTTTTAIGTTTTTARVLSQSFTAFVVRQASTTLTGTASTGMWGGELNARATSTSLGAVSGLVGFRYLNFHEDLNLNNSVHLFLPPGFADRNGLGGPLNTNLPTDLAFATTDRIRTRNEFYGGQIGLDLDMFVGRFIMDIRAKVALGVMHQTANVFGVSTLPDGTTAAGGLLSSAFDQGSHSRNRIAAIPEVNVKLGYLITPNLRAYVGYDFLYLSNVLRPGDQTGITTSGVSATVAGSTSQITVSQPAFRFSETDVWVQGINFGMELRY